jgi:hypothetical protein
MFFTRHSIETGKDGIWEIHTLNIKDVTLEDAGSYKIKATNRVGTTEETGTLAIVTEEPGFAKTLTDVTTKLGLTESFEVNMESILTKIPVFLITKGYAPLVIKRLQKCAKTNKIL